MKNKVFLSCLSTLLFVACQQQNPNENRDSGILDLQDSVEMDTTFVERLLNKRGGGVTGADGAISIDLKNGKSLFMWGDSFFGDVINDQRMDPVVFIMGNVFTRLGKDGNENFYNGTRSAPQPYIPTGDEKIKTWYWPGNGFVRDSTLFLFMSKFQKSGDGLLDFAFMQCDYFTLNKETLKVGSKQNFAAASKQNIHYGHAIWDDGQYVYVYGTNSDNSSFRSDIHVSRVQVKGQELVNFEYWDGKKWNPKSEKSTKISGLDVAVSEQFSVFKLNNKFVLLTQDKYKDIKNIYSFTSDKPEGPFTNKKLLYTVDEPLYEQDSMMTYNAMAHPQYQKNDKILVSYNVNTYDMKKIWKKASLYRPRFLWVPITTILN